MPSDSNGVYSLPTGYLAVTGEVIQASQHNPPLEDLASAMSARLMRTGAAPMTGPLKIVDGSVGSPGLQFANATSTGLYKTASGFGFSISGTRVVEFGPGGIVYGAHFIGELIPFVGLTAPPLCVLPYGQTLSRTTYADLWTFAQDEIAAGNTFFNNGDGSTTFGIGDMRGRVPAGKDNMGGVAASRLTTTTMSPNATTLGAVNGGVTGQTVMLNSANIPSISSTGSVTGTFVSSQSGVPLDATRGDMITNTAGGSFNGPGKNGALSIGQVSGSVSGTASVSYTNASQTGVAVVQPTIITNYVLFAGA